MSEDKEDLADTFGKFFDRLNNRFKRIEAFLEEQEPGWASRIQKKLDEEESQFLEEMNIQMAERLKEQANEREKLLDKLTPTLDLGELSDESGKVPKIKG